MTIVRRRKAPIHVDLPCELISKELPPLSALFLVYFDQKSGYTIGWKQSLPGVQLEGVVEYKSLPSGLHSVKQDLIYFVHGNYAGLSAFINAPAAPNCRNARMISIGVLVTHSQERIGRCWKHAEKLQEMASMLIVDTNMTEVLESYWEEYKATIPSHEIESPLLFASTINETGSFSSHQTQPDTHRRSLSASDSSITRVFGHTSSIHHPLWSIVKLLDKFGPLIFPIHRAALLRKRILITTCAPLHEACNFVYNICLISNIPLCTRKIVDHNMSTRPLQPLFSIGVQDITFLEEFQKLNSIHGIPNFSHSILQGNTDSGWIACTTDSIIATKSILYDVLINMPSHSSKNEIDGIWPKIEWPPGVELKATQRDFHRYKVLRNELSWHKFSSHGLSSRSSAVSVETELVSKMVNCTSTQRNCTPPEFPNMKSIIESVSWSALIYSYLTQSASMNEQYSSISTELRSGYLLSSDDPCASNSILARKEIAIIAYFQRLTVQYFKIFENVTDSTNSEDEQFDETQPLQFTTHDSEYENLSPIFISNVNFAKIGLDRWSENDYNFIRGLARNYFGRNAKIESCSLEICGIRII